MSEPGQDEAGHASPGSDQRRARALEARWAESSATRPWGERVQLASFPDGTLALRNSRYPDGLWLMFDCDAVRAFIVAAKAGEFDHLVENFPAS